MGEGGAGRAGGPAGVSECVCVRVSACILEGTLLGLGFFRDTSWKATTLRAPLFDTRDIRHINPSWNRLPGVHRRISLGSSWRSVRFGFP